MTNKWDAKYSERADKFAESRHWLAEANLLMRVTMDGRAGLGIEKPTEITILDLGCNSGALMDVVHRAGACGHINYVGIDPNTVGLNSITDRRSFHSFKTVSRATTLRGVASNSVDVVFCLHAINQMDDWGFELAEAYRVLKVGGKIAVLTHNVWWGRARRLQTIFSQYSSDKTMVREPTKTQVIKMMKQQQGFSIIEASYFDSVENPSQDWIASALGNRLMVVAEK